MSRPFSNSKTRIPNLERQNREKRDKTYVSSDDIKKIKTEIEASILAENAKIELNYNKAVESYKDVKDGQVKEFEKETKTLVDDTLVKDFNQIDNKYRDTYLELANDLVKDSKMTTKQKTDIFNLLSVLDERIKNKMYQKKLVNFDDISKSAAVIPNNLSTAEQDHIRFNPDYSASTMSDTVELPRDKEILLGVLEELPVEYRSVDLENSDIGAFIMQMKLRGNNIAIDLYLTNTLLTDNKYGTAVVSESAYNMDNSLMVCVYKELNTNKVYFTLKNVEYEKIRETLILTTSYNVLLGGKFTLPDEMGMLFIPDSNKYKRIGDGVIKGNEEGIVGPVNNVLIERDFYNNILQHIGLSESNVFGETVKVRINSIAKEIENADVNVIESRFNTTKDLKKAIENDPIIIDEDEILQVVDSEEDGRFIDNEPYKTYYDKVTKTLYIGSNWGLFAYNFTTQKTKNYTDIPKPVNKIKFDVKDNTLDVATDKGFYRIHNLGSDSERIEKKDLDFKVWNDKINYQTNIPEEYWGENKPEYYNDKTWANMSRIVKGDLDNCYKKCNSYQVKDFMHITADSEAPLMENHQFPDFQTLRSKTEEEIKKSYDIKDIQLIRGFRNGPIKQIDKNFGSPLLFQYETIEVATLVNSSDLLIRKFPEKEWTLIPALDENCTYNPISNGIWSYDDSTKDARGLLATITSTNKVFISNDLYSWRQVTLPEDTRGNTWTDIKWIGGWIPNCFKPEYNENTCKGVWMLISSTGNPANKILVSVDGENWTILDNRDMNYDENIGQSEWKYIISNNLMKEESRVYIQYINDIGVVTDGGNVETTLNNLYSTVCTIITDDMDTAAPQIYTNVADKKLVFSSSSVGTSGDYPENIKSILDKGYTKIKKLSINVFTHYFHNYENGYDSSTGYTDTKDPKIDIEFVGELVNPDTNKTWVIENIKSFSHGASNVFHKNNAQDMKKHIRPINIDGNYGFGKYISKEDGSEINITANDIRPIKIIHMIETITNRVSVRYALLFEKKIEGFDNKISVSQYTESFSLNQKYIGLEDCLYPEKTKTDSESRLNVFNNVFMKEEYAYASSGAYNLNNFDIDLNQDTMISTSFNLEENVDVVFYDNHFHIYCKSRESSSSPWVEHRMVTNDTQEFMIDNGVKNIISENYLFHVVTDRYVNARGKTSLEKTFVYREAYLYDTDNGGRKTNLIKTIKQLIGSSHIVDFYHKLMPTKLTNKHWVITNYRKDVNLFNDKPVTWKRLVKAMADLYLSNYEIPAGRIHDLDLNNSQDTFFDENLSCDETPTSLNTKNIAFIPYKYNGKRNFAIVVGKSDRNPFTRQRKERNYLEMGQLILTDFNEFVSEIERYPYAVIDEGLFDRVYKTDTMNIRNTALNMCDSYPDYDPENQYIYDRTSLIVHVLRENATKTEYLGRRYLRGNMTVMTNFVHIPHLNGYIFGDNYNLFYREAGNINEFLNHKNILYGKDKLGYGGNIVVLEDLDNSKTIIKIDKDSNTMVVLDKFETYTQMNFSWENISFPHPYKKNARDTDGITLYKALESTGMPYEVPCKCSGYVIFNGKKWYFSQVRISEPYETIHNDYDPGKFVEYGSVELLFDEKSKIAHDNLTVSSQISNLINNEFDNGKKGVYESYSENVGTFPGIAIGPFFHLAAIDSKQHNSRVATLKPLLTSWISPQNQYGIWDIHYDNDARHGLDSRNYATIDNSNSAFLRTGSGIVVRENIFFPTHLECIMKYDTKTYTWHRIASGFVANGQNSFAKNSLYYDKESDILYGLENDTRDLSKGTFLWYSTDFDHNEWKKVKIPVPDAIYMGISIKDNMLYLGNENTNNNQIYKIKMIGLDSRQSEYNFDKESGDYSVDKEYGKDITIINKRIVINNDKYEEVFFKDWEDPTSRYVHTAENTEPTVWAKLLAGEEVLCESDHDQTSLKRKTEWGETDDKGFTDQIRIIYKGPRYEKILVSGSEEEDPVYNIVEYSVFSVYSRDMINIIDRYENYSGIYKGNNRIYELPYNHGYTEKFILSPEQDDTNSMFGKKYSILETIIIWTRGSDEYLISHDAGENWNELTAPEPIQDLYRSSNGLGLIMVPKDKEYGDKCIYISLSYGDSFDYKVKTENQYLFDGIMMKNPENFLLFSKEKTNIYLNIPVEPDHEVELEESLLSIKYKVDEIYYFDNTEKNTVLLINKDSDSTVEKLLMSEDNGDVFKITMNDSEYHTLINLKSIEIDPLDGITKRRVLQWNRKMYKIKEMWMNPDPNITFEILSVTNFGSGNEIANAVSGYNGGFLSMFKYDPRLKKWVVVIAPSDITKVHLLLMDDIVPDETVLSTTEFREISFPIGRAFVWDIDIMYLKNINRNIIWFNLSNNSQSGYKILDINYKQEGFTNPGFTGRYDYKIDKFYDDPNTGEVFILGMNGTGNYVEPKRMNFDSRLETTKPYLGTFDNNASDYADTFGAYSGNQRMRWYVIDTNNIGSGLGTKFIYIDERSAITYSYYKKNRNHNVDQLSIERKINHHYGTGYDLAMTNANITNIGGHQTTSYKTHKQIFTQGFDLTVLFSKRKMTKNDVETL